MIGSLLMIVGLFLVLVAALGILLVMLLGKL